MREGRVAAGAGRQCAPAAPSGRSYGPSDSSGCEGAEDIVRPRRLMRHFWAALQLRRSVSP